MATLEEAFELFKQLPDWDKYPMPEVFYQHFHVKKPKPSYEVAEAVVYTTPPYESLNKNGKVEIRLPAEGGVRQIEELPALPVEVKMLTDEELEEANKPTDQSADDKKPDSEPKPVLSETIQNGVE